MNMLTTARIALAILPVVKEVVTTVEEMYSTESGSAKKALAIDVIKTIYNATHPEISYEELSAHVGGFIDAVVSSYNAIGKFVKAVQHAA